MFTMIRALLKKIPARLSAMVGLAVLGGVVLANLSSRPENQIITHAQTVGGGDVTALTDLDPSTAYKMAAGKPITFSFPNPQQIARIVIKTGNESALFTVAADKTGTGTYAPSTILTIPASGSLRDTGYIGPETAQKIQITASADSDVAEIELYKPLLGSSNLFFTMQPGHATTSGGAPVPVGTENIKDWAEKTISALVPGKNDFYGPVLSVPKSLVSVKTLSNDSNQVPFNPMPVVTGVSPSRGPVGTWVTITGRGFGDEGTVQFCKSINSANPTDCSAALPALPVPEYCPAPWTDTAVIVQVPAADAATWALDSARYAQVTPTATNLKSALHAGSAFVLDNSPLPPGICAIVKNTTAGSVFVKSTDVVVGGDSVGVAGEGFANTNNALFVSSQSATVPSTQVQVDGINNVSVAGDIKISDDNISGQAFVITKGVRKSSELYCPIGTNTASQDFTGSQHQSGYPSAQFSDGPLYSISENTAAIAAGRDSIPLTGEKADSSVAYRVIGDALCSGKQCGVWRYPTNPLVIVGSTGLIVNANLFHFGRDLQAEVPASANLANIVKIGNPPDGDKTRSIGYEVALYNGATKVQSVVGRVPANGSVVPVVADFGIVPAGTYSVQILQTDQISFTCATCNPTGQPRAYRTMLGVQSVSIQTISGLTQNGQCLDSTGKIVAKQAMDIPVTLTSNPLPVRINEASVEKSVTVSLSSPAATTAVCPNAGLIVSVVSPCPIGTSDDPITGACVDVFGEYVSRVSVSESSARSIALFRKGTGITCDASERRVTQGRLSELGLSDQVVGKTEVSTYCELPVSVTVNPKMSANAAATGKAIAYMIEVVPSAMMQYPSSAYTLIIPVGACSGVSSASCTSAHLGTNGLSPNPAIRVPAFKPSVVSVSFTTDTKICTAKRIEVSPANVQFRDSITPVSMRLRAFTGVDTEDPTDQLLSNAAFSTALDQNAKKFTTLDTSLCVTGSCPKVTPIQGSINQDTMSEGAVTITAAHDASTLLAQSEATVTVPISAVSCDLPWLFKDQDLNFKMQYCSGSIGGSANLPVLGNGPGSYTSAASGGVIIKSSPLDVVKKDTGGNVPTLLKEFLFPVKPNTGVAAMSLITIPGSVHEGGQPNEGCVETTMSCAESGYQGRSSDSFFSLSDPISYKFSISTAGTYQIGAIMGAAFSDMSQSQRCVGTPKGSLAERYVAKGLAAGTLFDPAAFTSTSTSFGGTIAAYTQKSTINAVLHQVTSTGANGSTIATKTGSQSMVQITSDLANSTNDTTIGSYDLVPGDYRLTLNLSNWVDSSWNTTSNAVNCNDQPIPVVRYGLEVAEVRVQPAQVSMSNGLLYVFRDAVVVARNVLNLITDWFRG